MKSEISILIAEDQPIFRSGLRNAIETDPALKIIAEAGDAETAIERVRALLPDIAILDISMPGRDDRGGFAVAREIRKERLAVEVIFLTFHDEEDFFEEALNLGAKGYVLKDCALADIVNCVKAVAAGKYYTSPEVTTYVFNRSEITKDNPTGGSGDEERHPIADADEETDRLKLLTKQERRILKMVSEFKTTPEIAEELFIDPATVETHKTNIRAKLEIRGPHALMKFALKRKDEL